MSLIDHIPTGRAVAGQRRRRPAFSRFIKAFENDAANNVPVSQIVALVASDNLSLVQRLRKMQVVINRQSSATARGFMFWRVSIDQPAAVAIGSTPTITAATGVATPFPKASNIVMASVEPINGQVGRSTTIKSFNGRMDIINGASLYFDFQNQFQTGSDTLAVSFLTATLDFILSN